MEFYLPILVLSTAHKLHTWRANGVAPCCRLQYFFNKEFQGLEKHIYVEREFSQASMQMSSIKECHTNRKI